MIQQSRLSAFIDELRRRRVVRAAAFYGGIAFVIIQIIDGAFSYLHIPEWFGTAIIILLLVGFPVAMVLAWAFDITEEGIVRAKGRPVGAKRKALPLVGNTALAIIAVVAIAFGIWGRWGGTADDPWKASVAVLPFVTFSTEPGDQYFADGMTDNLITQLYKVSDLKVIARTSVMQYRNTTKRMNQIGAELGVNTLLEGSIQRSSARVIINAQLIDVQTEAHLWAETYDRHITDLFDIQSEVAGKIARALKGELTPDEEEALSYRPTENLAAWEAYSRGLGLHAGRALEVEGLAETLRAFEQATALDPRFVEAWAYQVMTHTLTYWFSYDITPRRLELAKMALSRAEQLAPQHPLSLLARGRYYYHGFRDYGRALQVMYRALDAAPDHPEILVSIAYVERRLGQFDSALAHLFRAAELDPGSAANLAEVASTLEAVGRYEEALAYFHRSARLSPAGFSYHGILRLTHLQTSDLDSTLAAVAPYRSEALDGYWQAAEGHLMMEVGDLQSAVELLTQGIDRLPASDRVAKAFGTLGLGLAYHFLGDKEQTSKTATSLIKTLTTDVDQPLNGAWFRSIRGAARALLEDYEGAKRDVDRGWAELPTSVDAGDGNAVGSNRALAYLLMGDTDTALKQWDTMLAVSQWLLDVRELESYRTWAPLKKHPGYQDLIAKYSGGVDEPPLGLHHRVPPQAGYPGSNYLHDSIICRYDGGRSILRPDYSYRRCPLRRSPLILTALGGPGDRAGPRPDCRFRPPIGPWIGSLER